MQLNNIDVWKKQFGLLPIHLTASKQDAAYIMLNGGYGDFCLQTEADQGDEQNIYSKSWSSNTNNFIVLGGDQVQIYNWAKKHREEVTVRQVADNFEKFYNYILSKSIRSDRDIVPFIINIFQQFRNITLEKSNPVEALNLLFHLLACIEDDSAQLDQNKWHIKPVKIPQGFELFINQIKAGFSDIKPNLDLIIRHSAGVLFQEAQKEVLFFDRQLDLFGSVSSRIETKQNLYSSIHYTPPYLARTIVENVINKLDLTQKTLRVFDPACGSAEFLVELLKQLKELNYLGTVQVQGWDTSETAINTSNFLLGYEQRTVWNDRLTFQTRLVADSLTEEWEQNFDAILMNPPFVSWEHLERTARFSVREVLGSSFQGRPNEASAFFYKAVQSIGNTGVIGCVMPSSILTLDSYKKLRSEISEHLTLDLIGKLGNFVFDDALTDVSILVGSKPKTERVPYILWARNDRGNAQNALREFRKMNYNQTSAVRAASYSIFQPVSFPVVPNSWKAISIQEHELVKTILRFEYDRKLVKVKEVFAVRQGVNSGNNKLFKLNREEFERLPVRERKYFRPAVDSAAIQDGQLFYTSYIWYPYDKNGLTINSEVEFKKKVPTFYKRLHKDKQTLVDRSRIDNKSWWRLSEHRAWLLKKEFKLVSARFGNCDSFAIDKSGEFVVENGSAWLPLKPFRSSDYYFYLAIFLSPFFDTLLSIYSKQLSGGAWYDLGMKYSQEIPIPDVHSEEVRSSEAYRKLVAIGEECASGNIKMRYLTEEILVKYFYPKAKIT